MTHRLRPGTRATLQVRQLESGEFAWIITLMDPDSGNVRSTTYSPERFTSTSEASREGKAAVKTMLADSDIDRMAIAPLK